MCDEKDSREGASVLVVGGGVAGMTAALAVADAGVRVHLVEKQPELGGVVRRLHALFPSMESPAPLIGSLVERVTNNDRIVVHTRAEITEVKGAFPEFTVIITDSEGGRPPKELTEASIILATGLETIDPSMIPEFGYGRYREVITSLEFEDILADAERGGATLSRRTDGKPVKTLVFIQCVGSRVEKRGVPYCSAVCCMGAIKNSILVKERHPEIDVFVLYIDIRAQGKGCEELYKRARKAGVKFIRGQPSLVVRRSGSDRLLVCGENTLLRELYEIPADMVVLSVGLTQSRRNEDLLRMLGVPLTGERLAKGIGPHRDPFVSPVPGVFLAGTMESPKDVRDTITQAEAAALASLRAARSRERIL